MRLERVSETDAEWLRATTEQISRRFGIDVVAVSDDLLVVRPKRANPRTTHPDRVRTKDSRAGDIRT
jgi:hypothetical protein